MVMAAPALAGLLLFVALPFLLAIGLSLTDFKLGSPLAPRFIGLHQYQSLLHDAGFLRALLNNGFFAVVVVPLQTLLALGLALLLNRQLAGLVLFRTLFFMPVVFPMSLVAVIWILIYAPGPQGMMNAFLSLLTLGGWEAKDFLHDPLWVMPAIMFMSIWQGVGFQMVILLAALQNIPAELYEAARIDGAGPWQRFINITLPQLRNPLLFVVLLTTILAFRLFDQIQIMTRGGPNDASTTVIFETVRAVFERQQLARAAAMTVIFFLIVLAVTALLHRCLRQEEGQ
ncbi:MAG: carbohydrate ABC transporter permease [Gammaproteobacteria bacterium]